MRFESWRLLGVEVFPIHNAALIGAERPPEGAVMPLVD